MTYYDYVKMWMKLMKYCNDLFQSADWMIGIYDDMQTGKNTFLRPENTNSFKDFFKECCEHDRFGQRNGDILWNRICIALEEHSDEFSEEEREFLMDSDGFNAELEEVYSEWRVVRNKMNPFSNNPQKMVDDIIKLYDDGKYDECVEKYVDYLDKNKDENEEKDKGQAKADERLFKHITFYLSLEDEMSPVHKKILDRILEDVSSLDGVNDDKKLEDIQKYCHAMTVISEGLQDNIQDEEYFNEKINNVAGYYRGFRKLIAICDKNPEKYKDFQEEPFVKKFISRTIERTVELIIEKKIKVLPFEEYFTSKKKEFENEDDKNAVAAVVDNLIAMYKAATDDKSMEDVQKVFNVFKEQKEMTAVHQYLSNKLKSGFAESTDALSAAMKSELLIYAQVLDKITGDELKNKLAQDNPEEEKKIFRILTDKNDKNNNLFNSLYEINLSEENRNIYYEVFNSPYFKKYHVMAEMIMKPKDKYAEDKEFMEAREDFLKYKITAEQFRQGGYDVRINDAKQELDGMANITTRLENVIVQNDTREELNALAEDIKRKCTAITEDFNILKDTITRVDVTKNSEQFVDMVQALDMFTNEGESIYSMIAHGGEDAESALDINNKRTVSVDYLGTIVDIYREVGSYVDVKGEKFSHLVSNGKARYQAASRIKGALAELIEDINNYNTKKNDYYNKPVFSMKTKVQQGDAEVEKEVNLPCSEVVKVCDEFYDKFKIKAEEYKNLKAAKERSKKDEKNFAGMLNGKKKELDKDNNGNQKNANVRKA